MIIEPCCYRKQLNEYLASTDADVVPIFHSGDVLASHLLERCGVMSSPSSTLWIVLPQITTSLVTDIQHLADQRIYSVVDKATVPTFSVINILTRQPDDALLSLTAQSGQTINIAKDRQLGFRLVGYTNDTTNQNLLITGSVIQTIQFGSQLLEFHRGSAMKDDIIPYIERQIRFHKVNK